MELLEIQSLSRLCSKKVKLSGVVTEDKMTGDRYVTHVTVMEDMMGPKQPESQEADSPCTTQGRKDYH